MSVDNFKILVEDITFDNFDITYDDLCVYVCIYIYIFKIPRTIIHLHGLLRQDYI